MKHIFVLLLATVMTITLLAGCKPDDHEGDEDTLVLKTPNAMASFGNSPVAGVQTQEPADLAVKGTSAIKTVSTLVGDYDSTYTVRTLKGYGSEMSFTLEGIAANLPVMIDIEEIHLRDDASIAYSVYVNGTEVFGRSYAVSADGPNHAYFDVSADVTMITLLRFDNGYGYQFVYGDRYWFLYEICNNTKTYFLGRTYL